jgi:2-oxoglutarate ferredoxin oxidoreductase subunit alpha
MLENLGLATMLEVPCVLVDIQRGSPSTGLPTMAGQSDVMQVRWGSHGDFRVIAYTPWSPQEMFDLTVLAFNMADRYRVPVMVLGDEVIGHMVERVVIPPASDIPHWGRKRPPSPPNGHAPIFAPDPADLVPPMAHAGEGYRVHFTGLTHDERGYPAIDPETHHQLVTRLAAKIERNAADIIRTEAYALEDADIAVVAYGCTARSARRAVQEARRQGVRAGLLRLISLWPFPESQVKALAAQVDAFIVAEMNLGQVRLELERHICRPATGIHHAGGAMIPPEPILQAILEVGRRD